MKRLLAVLLIGLLVSLAPQPAQAQGGSCPNATIEHYGEGSSYALRMNSNPSVTLTSVTLNWTSGPILMNLYWIPPNTNSHPIADGSYTFNPNITLDSNGIFILYGFSSFIDVNDFTYSCTTEPLPTSTPTLTPEPTPTSTPEVYNVWGQGITQTGIVEDFTTTMAAANGGTPIDMTPYEIPTPSVAIPALAISVADLSVIGKSAVTLWALLDQFDVLPFYFMIAIALAVVWWLYRFITDLPTPTPDMDVTGAMDAYTGYDDWQVEQSMDTEQRIQDALEERGGIDTELGRSIYDDSVGRMDDLKDRTARNTNRRQAVKQGVSLTRRLKKLF